MSTTALAPPKRPEIKTALPGPKGKEIIQADAQFVTPSYPRPSFKLVAERAQGVWVEDVDGNEYIDYVLAWGPMILGYRHPAIVEAMRRQAELPTDYGAQHELEFLVSEQIQGLMPCAELVAFTRRNRMAN